MDMVNLLPALRFDEGRELRAYGDPITRGPPWTIGYGHTGKNVHPGLEITLEQAEALLINDVNSVILALDASLPWWRGLNSPRQNVLANMGFNMGVGKLVLFHNTLSAVRSGYYTQAGPMMLESAWADQVGKRAIRLAKQMETGVEQPLI